MLNSYVDFFFDFFSPNFVIFITLQEDVLNDRNLNFF
jgi:2-hydroxychromene-2-carboxylate isomerase